jgi:hypothetical protein
MITVATVRQLRANRLACSRPDDQGQRAPDRARNRLDWSRADQRRMMRSLEDVY